MCGGRRTICCRAGPGVSPVRTATRISRRGSPAAWARSEISARGPCRFFWMPLLSALSGVTYTTYVRSLWQRAGEVREGLGDGRQGGSVSDHGFILSVGSIAGRGARDQHGAAERPAGRVVALELMFLDEGVLPENQRRRTHGGRHYTKRLAGMQTDFMVVIGAAMGVR